MKTLNFWPIIFQDILEENILSFKENENVNLEINKDKQILASTEAEIYEYAEITIHRLLENIRIMEDNTAIITLKGGYNIEEPIIQSQI